MNSDALERILACARCHGTVQVLDDKIVCRTATCGFEGSIVDGVVRMLDSTDSAAFDTKYQGMREANEGCAAHILGYQQQAVFLRPFLRPGTVILDAGCGPVLPFSVPDECIVVGLDTSFYAVRSNRDVDVRVHGSVTSLPIPDRSVDTLVCFYSIHHMVGDSLADNHSILYRGMAEFGRVLKSGGDLIVFEMSPRWPLPDVQEYTWDALRNMFGGRLDVYFATAASLQKLGQQLFKERATHQEHRFRLSPLTWVPATFSLPWVRIPRLLYPFHISAYHWHFA